MADVNRPPRDAKASDALAALNRLNENQQRANRDLQELKADVKRRNRGLPSSGAGDAAAGTAETTFTAGETGAAEQISRRGGELVRTRRELVELGRQDLQGQLRYLDVLRQRAALTEAETRSARELQGIRQRMYVAGRVTPGDPAALQVVQRSRGGMADAQRADALAAEQEAQVQRARDTLRQEQFAAQQQMAARTRLARVTTLAEPVAVTAARPNMSAYLGELQRAAVIQQSASQAMRRHGALTTEFLAALARGETTLSEFRFQIGSTIAKFAGWTAAASGVYLVVDAIRQMGTGAIDAMSGVNELQRFITTGFNPDQAMKSFGDLSEHFNLPISTVVQATSGIAKVYKDQGDALEATKAVLLAVQVGEVNQADAIRYLIPIARAWGVEAGSLTDILDMANQAQNRFGASIPDMLAGMAKASAAFKGAGGDLDTFVALITTLQLRSGESGQTIGTALARSAQRILRPVNQETLRSFGIDPTQGISQVIGQAMKIAPTLSSQEMRRLAGQGLSTPEYARFFTALLQPEGQALYQQAGAETNREGARGSAEREFQVFIGSANQQIARIGTNLQNIGLQLARSGALDFLGAMLHTLNLTLSTINNILEVANRIPEPFRSLAVYAAQAYAALALMRRSGLGTGLAERFGGSFQDPNRRGGAADFLAPNQEDRERRRAVSGLRALQESLDRDAEQAANVAAARRGQATAAARSAELMEAERLQLVKQGATASEINFYNAQINKERALAARLQAEAAALAQRELAATALANENRSNLKGLQQRELTVAELAAQQGGTFYLGGPVGARQRPEGVTGEIPAAPAREISSIGQRVERIGMQAAVAMAMLGTAQDGTRRASGLMAPAAEKVAVASRTAGTAATFAGTKLTGAAVAMRGLPVSMGRFISALGLIDGLFIGFAAFELLDHILSSTAEAFDKTLADIEKIPTSADALNNAAKRLADGTADVKAPDSTSVKSSVTDGLIRIRNFIQTGNPAELIAEGNSQILEEAERSNNRMIQQFGTERQRALRIGRNAPNRRSGAGALYGPEIFAQMKADRDALNQGAIDRQEFNRRYQLRLDENRNSIAARVGNDSVVARRAADLKRMYQEAEAAQFGTLEAFLAADPKGQQDLADQQSQIIASRRPSKTGVNIRALARYYVTAARLYTGSTDKNEIETLAKVRDDYYNSLQSQVQDELDQSLKMASSPAERQRAYGTALARLNTRREQLAGSRSSSDQRLRDSERELASVNDLLGTAERGGAGIAGRNLPDLRKRRDVLLDEVKDLRRRAKNAKEGVQDMDQRIKALEQELEKAAFEDRESRRSIVSTYASSRAALTGDDAGSLAVQIRIAGNSVRDAIKTFGRTSDEALKAIAAQNQLLAQQAQQSVQDVRDKADLAASRIIGVGPTYDRSRLAQQEQGARDALTTARKTGNQKLIDDAEKTLNGLRQQRVELNKTQADDAKKKAEDAKRAAEELRDARDEYELSGIEDPIAKARATLRQDQRNLKGKTGADRYRQMAKVRDDQTTLRGLVQDEELSDLRHRHTMDQLTDQQYIAELKKILATRKLGKQARQQLEEEIHGLQKQDGSELQIGTDGIRLPTMYEIRRALGGKNPGDVVSDARRAGIAHTNNNTFNVTIYGAEGADAFGKQIETGIGVTRNALRSKGVLG